MKRSSTLISHPSRAPLCSTSLWEVMMSTSDFVTDSLFSQFDAYGFIRSWPEFVICLQEYLNGQAGETLSGLFGTTKVVNSIIGEDVSLGDFSLIRNSIVEPGVRIGAHVQINMSVIQSKSEFPHMNNV